MNGVFVGAKAPFVIERGSRSIRTLVEVQHHEVPSNHEQEMRSAPGEKRNWGARRSRGSTHDAITGAVTSFMTSPSRKCDPPCSTSGTWSTCGAREAAGLAPPGLTPGGDTRVSRWCAPNTQVTGHHRHLEGAQDTPPAVSSRSVGDGVELEAQVEQRPPPAPREWAGAGARQRAKGGTPGTARGHPQTVAPSTRPRIGAGQALGTALRLAQPVMCSQPPPNVHMCTRAPVR